MTVQLESTQATPDSVVVPLRGELDIATLDQVVDRALAFAVPGSALVLDLSRVTFCDCSGLRALLRIARDAGVLGCAVALTAPSPSMIRLLAITGVSDRLPLLDESITRTSPVPVPAA